MPVVLVHEGPTLTQERYEAAVRRAHRRRAAAPDALPTGRSRGSWSTPPAGHHGFRVVDLWASEDAAGGSARSSGSNLQEVGITDLPETYPAHTFVSA